MCRVGEGRVAAVGLATVDGAALGRGGECCDGGDGRGETEAVGGRAGASFEWRGWEVHILTMLAINEPSCENKEIKNVQFDL